MKDLTLRLSLNGTLNYLLPILICALAGLFPCVLKSHTTPAGCPYSSHSATICQSTNLTESIPWSCIGNNLDEDLEDISFLNKSISELKKGTSSSDLVNCAGTDLGGNVWKDYDADGIQDSNETATVEDITVDIYDCDGMLVGTDTTDINGDWSVDPSNISFPVRVEFSNLPSWAYWTLNGAEGSTSVQFINSANCNVDASVGDISRYCESNPLMITPCYVQSNEQNLDVMVSFSYENEGTASQDKEVVTESQQAGSLWGLAYDQSNKVLYSAAVLKRHIPLGPSGLDAIYTVDPFSGTPNATPWIELTDDLGIAVSPITAEPQYHTNVDRGLSVYSQNDPDAFQDAGKVGLGDIELSVDRQTLYVVNLFDKTLYAINTATKTISGTYPIPNPGCSNGEARPWAVGEYEGKIFVGVTCDGGSSGNPANLTDNSGVNNLSASVYRLDNTTFTQVLNFPLNYPREVPFQYSGGCDQVDRWKPWLSVIPATCDDGNIAYPTPLLSDIEFADNGDMVLGFIDRTGFQIGNRSYGPTGEIEYSMYAAGDILKACKLGTNWGIENTSSGCSSAGGLAINTYDANGYGVPWGFLGKQGEFYEGDFFHGDGNIDGTGVSFFPGHPEITIGGLAVIPGTNEVMSTSYDPVTGASNFGTGGVIILDNTTGQRTRNGYELYRTEPDGITQAKGVGLGDLEALCVATPNQIGNYVWLDTDRDGVQDPCESGIQGVNVSLYELVGGTSTLIATTTTSANGTYYFTDYEQYGSGYDTLTIGNQYAVVVGENGQFDNSNSTLSIGSNEYVLTSQNTGEGANPDLNDSDAYLVNDSTKPFNEYPVDTVTIQQVGFVNHTLDFGFIPVIKCTNPDLATLNEVICNGENIDISTLLTDNNNIGGTLSFYTTYENVLASTNPLASSLVAPVIDTKYYIREDTSTCFDIDSLTISVHPSNITAIDTNVCKGASIDVADLFSTTDGTLTYHSATPPTTANQLTSTTINNITSSQQYYGSVNSANGCNDIAEATISVIVIDTTDLMLAICEGDSYPFNNQTLDSAGTYLDTLVQINGCDSIISLTLTINPVDTVDIAKTICKDQIYTFNGQTIDMAGTYLDTMTQSSGCDSIIRLSLTVNSVDTIDNTDIAQTICQGDSYLFNGQSLSTSGIYFDTLTQINSCDSIITLTLTVNENPIVVVEDAIKCTINPETIMATVSGGTGNYSYLWTGPFVNNPGDVSSFLAKNPGIYTVLITGENGCTATDSGELITEEKKCLPVTITIKRTKE